jgi:hypothetical protein
VEWSCIGSYALSGFTVALSISPRRLNGSHLPAGLCEILRVVLGDYLLAYGLGGFWGLIEDRHSFGNTKPQLRIAAYGYVLLLTV